MIGTIILIGPDLAMAGWSKSQWQRFIRQAAADPVRVVYTDHALMRMKTRQVSRSAALDILKKGTVRREPEPNLRFGTTECRVEYYVAGRNLALVAAVKIDNPAIVIVTAIDMNKE